LASATCKSWCCARERSSTAPARQAVYVVRGLLPSVLYLAQRCDTHVTCLRRAIDSMRMRLSGFDQGSPLLGRRKAVVCRELAARHGAIAMVGDGMTDVAARAGAPTSSLRAVAYRETVARCRLLCRACRAHGDAREALTKRNARRSRLRESGGLQESSVLAKGQLDLRRIDSRVADVFFVLADLSCLEAVETFIPCSCASANSAHAESGSTARSALP